MLLTQQKTVIGTNIRHFRLLRGFTLSQLAKKAECSESLLSKIENGKATPSLSLLLRIARSLDATVGQIFNSETQVHEPLLRSDERPSVEPGKFGDVVKTQIDRLSPFFEGRLMQSHLVSVDPGGRTLADLQHPGEIFGYVLEGVLTLELDGERYTLEAGDTFQFRAEQGHAFANKSSSVARIIWVVTPPTY